MKKSLIPYLLISLCLVTLCQAQEQANVWYFGSKLGLDFNYNPPLNLFDGKISMDGITSRLEPSSSISNENGDLLFYTNGVTVWNKFHEVMPNGTELWGDNTTTQTLIVPKPNSTEYYIFTASPDGDNPNFPIDKKGFRYSLVDMSLEGGLGDVFEKNILLSLSTTEKISATRHINGKDVWVVMHEWNSNIFRTYLVDENGVNTKPVISETGSIHSGPSQNYSANAVGQMKISPNSELLGLVIYQSNKVELFNFNPSNGIIKMMHSLSLISLNSGGFFYGLEFSPSSRYLYITANSCDIYQLDLFPTMGDTSFIKISGSPPCHNSNQLQLGPDGKIYVAQESHFFLGVINNPEEPGVLCEYVYDGISFPINANQYCGSGLPNFISSYFYKPELYPQRPYFEMPNVFTPNGDGYNDRFVPMVNYNVVSGTLAVYNRWGEQVFQTTNLENGWDGGECSPGVYYWIVHYLGTNGKSYFQKGTVQLVK